MLLLFLIFGFLAQHGSCLFENCITPPLECPNLNITFWLNTNKIPDTPHIISVSDPDSINNAPFQSKAKTIVIIHGYASSGNSHSVTKIKSAYFEYGEFNVISVNYKNLTKDGCYIESVENVPLIGKCTAQILDRIVILNKIVFETIHVIGFSLGAHIAGRLSQWLSTGKLSRVTGLDPALPLFDTEDKSKKLGKGAAKFVDIIHTNIQFFGMLESCGHADFYVNGGHTQPGCPKSNWTVENGCNHVRAPIYYAESINTKVGFYGFACADWLEYHFGLCKIKRDNSTDVIMGMHTPITARGSFFVKTNDSPPFALGYRNSTRQYKPKIRLPWENEQKLPDQGFNNIFPDMKVPKKGFPSDM